MTRPTLTLPLLASLVACLAASARAEEGAAVAPVTSVDFAGAIGCPKLAPARGKRPLLLILWDPGRASDPAPPAELMDALVFGKQRPSMADWFREASNGQLELVRAGTIGWVKASKPAAHYFEPRAGEVEGWVNGHVEKWADAVTLADAQFDFARWDANKDGVLQPHELGVLIAIPQRGPFGTNRPPLGREVPPRPLVVDGVRIPVIAEWYTGAPQPNLGVAIHETCHLLLGTPDLYMTGPWPYAAGGYSLMDSSYVTSHLDAFMRLKLGWVGYRAVTRSETVRLRAVERGGGVVIVYDPARGPGEYLLLELRWARGSYDAGAGPHGGGIRQSGLAVWHVVEDPTRYAKLTPPTGAPHEWGRRGLRLLRQNGGVPCDDAAALFHARGARLADDTRPARLAWSDGAPTGISLELLGDAAETVEVRIELR